MHEPCEVKYMWIFVTTSLVEVSETIRKTRVLSVKIMQGSREGGQGMREEEEGWKRIFNI